MYVLYCDWIACGGIPIVSTSTFLSLEVQVELDMMRDVELVEEYEDVQSSGGHNKEAP